MKLGVILPHTKLFGGVKRFFELGNIFIDKGHEFIVFTPEGLAPDWFNFNGKIDVLNNLSSYSLDALFFVEVKVLKNVLEAKAKNKIFYYVITKKILKDIVKHPEIKIFANSTNVYEYAKKHYRIESFKAFGGVDVKKFATTSPKTISDEITVMVYGRLNRKRKGARFVIRACERLYRRGKKIKLLLFDTPVDEKSKELIEKFTCKVPHEFVLNHPVNDNKSLFRRGDIFVSAEKRAGWSNTSAEAMASEVAVIATKSGTKDIIINNETGLVIRRNSFSIAKAINKLINSEELRNKLAANGRKYIEKFDWEILANNIYKYLEDKV